MGCEPELLNKKARPAKARKLNLPAGVPPLASLYMYIAGACNLACRHCWINPTYEPDNAKGQFLKFEYVKKAVTEAKPLGLRTVKLTGGEPMLHPQFREIVEYIDNEGIEIILETNGTLIDQDSVNFLKSKSRICFISISLDGATAARHEALRGVRGSFDRAVRGIKLLAAAGFQPQLICTLHKDNSHEIDKTIALAQSLGCGSVKFNILQQIGRGNDLYAEFGLSVKDILTLYNEFLNNQKNASHILTHFDIPIAFKPIKEILHGASSRCAIHNVLGILASGDYALCGIGTTEKKYIFGSVREHEIGAIWENNQILNELRLKIPLEFEGICLNCIFCETCLGHCIIGNHERAARLNNSFPFCIEADTQGFFPESRKKNVRRT
jgi:SynChlorMet cassette radical SAM/SPASM protein ScmF